MGYDKDVVSVVGEEEDPVNEDEDVLVVGKDRSIVGVMGTVHFKYGFEKRVETQTTKKKTFLSRGSCSNTCNNQPANIREPNDAITSWARTRISSASWARWERRNVRTSSTSWVLPRPVMGHPAHLAPGR